LHKHEGQTGVEFGAGAESNASSIRIVSPLRIGFVATRHRPFSRSTVNANIIFMLHFRNLFSSILYININISLIKIGEVNVLITVIEPLTLKGQHLE
jgi:hypothetical protein